MSDEIDPLPHVRVGRRHRRVDAVVDLEAWLARRRQITPAPPVGLFAGFSDEARRALEGLFCTQTCTRNRKTFMRHTVLTA